jgi:hypothetical protein
LRQLAPHVRREPGIRWTFCAKATCEVHCLRQFRHVKCKDTRDPRLICGDEYPQTHGPSQVIFRVGIPQSGSQSSSGATCRVDAIARVARIRRSLNEIMNDEKVRCDGIQQQAQHERRPCKSASFLRLVDFRHPGRLTIEVRSQSTRGPCAEICSAGVWVKHRENLLKDESQGQFLTG